MHHVSRFPKFYLVLYSHWGLSHCSLPVGTFVVFAFVMPADLWFLGRHVLGRHIPLGIFSRGLLTRGTVVLLLGSFIL